MKTALRNKADLNHTHVSSQVGLGKVTNDKQVKAATTSTDGNLIIWSGTTGDKVADSGKKPADFASVNHNHTGVYEAANANIQQHISAIGNPHGTTKDDVSLGNVTDDAQLTRGAGDINSFH